MSGIIAEELSIMHESMNAINHACLTLPSLNDLEETLDVDYDLKSF